MAGDEKTFHFRAGNDVCRAQAYVPVSADGAQRRVRFDLPRISYIFEGDEAGTSRIRLDSGLVIPVRLSLEDLDAVLHTPDVETVKDGIIDLTSVTSTELSPAKDLSPVTVKKQGDDVAPKLVGDVMPDGTIYAGVSPETGNPLYVMPGDAAMTMNFNEAAEYIRELKFGGKSDFRLPTYNELTVIYANRDRGSLKGSFNSVSHAYYWTSTGGQPGYKKGRAFKDGLFSEYLSSDSCYPVRLVRSEGKIKISIPQPGR